MTTPGLGIPSRIDGPPPVPPRFSLFAAAAAQAPEVNVIDDLDALQVPRWGNGVQIRPYPTDLGEVWDECARGSAHTTKIGGDELPAPYYGAMTAYVPASCTTFSVFGSSPASDWPALFAARAARVLAAVESSIIEREFMTGRVMPDNPHLADATDGVYPLGGFPHGDAATSVVNAVGLLENAIAQSGRAGIIHCTPAFATVAAAHGFAFDKDTGVLRTKNGTIVIPGYGYAQALVRDASHPHGHPAAGATQEWVYATGPIEVRRSPVFTTPEAANVAEAVNRSTNELEFFIERFYLVDWDTALHAAVLADRCQETC